MSNFAHANRFFIAANFIIIDNYSLATFFFFFIFSLINLHPILCIFFSSILSNCFRLHFTQLSFSLPLLLPFFSFFFFLINFSVFFIRFFFFLILIFPSHCSVITTFFFLNLLPPCRFFIVDFIIGLFYFPISHFSRLLIFLSSLVSSFCFVFLPYFFLSRVLFLRSLFFPLSFPFLLFCYLCFLSFQSDFYLSFSTALYHSSNLLPSLTFLSYLLLYLPIFVFFSSYFFFFM